jgi:putative ABC transport system permease protein
MNLVDIFFMSTHGVKERKFRFVLNIVGILIGCMAVTGLVSLTQGLNDLVNNQLDKFGPNNVIIMPGSLEMGAGLITSQSFTWRDVQLVENIANVEIGIPVVGGKICSFTQQGKKRYAFLYGVDSEFFEIMSGWEIEKGRCIYRGDTGVVVLGKEIADPKDQTFHRLEVGDRVSLTVIVDGIEKEMTFRVVGILERMGGIGGISSDEDRSIFMPLKVCQQLFDEGGTFQYIYCRVKTVENVPQVVADIEAQFGEDVTVMTSESIQELIGTILGAVESLLGGVAAISLIVAGVGIVNTMTISVLERTKEIGILKAVGSKSLDILFIFLSEAIITGIIGGVIGSALGLTLGRMVGNMIDMPTSSSPFLFMGVVVFAVITTAISGIYPAWRAAKMHPVEALRSE